MRLSSLHHQESNMRRKSITSCVVWLRRPGHWVFIAALLVAALSGSAFADGSLNPIGGPGGGPFVAHCPEDQLLAGFELRAADDVDAIRPLCVIASAPRTVSVAAAEDNWYGGTGGSVMRVICPRYTPIVTGMYVRAEGRETEVVNNIHLFCGVASDQQAASDSPAAFYDAADSEYHGLVATIMTPDSDTQHCPAGLVAVGVRGRSGKWLDAIGLICGPPPAPGKTLGHVNAGTPSPPHPPGWTLCDAARDARARNSPAAPDLEAQCRKVPAKTLGRENADAPFPKHPSGWTLCDAARDARARNSPAAPDLERQCTAIKAKADPAVTPVPPSTPAYLYAIDGEGKLRWFRHDGAANGTFAWQGPRVVDMGWRDLRQVFPGGDGTIYAITRNGVLIRYQHAGFRTGLGKDDPGGWGAPQQLATGWGDFTQAFSAGHGVIYAIARDGTLKWYRLTGFANGRATMIGPRNVGRGWNGVKVFSAGDGVIYTITGDGKLMWDWHYGYMSGEGLETPAAWEARKQVGTGWNDFEHVFATGNGIIYAVTRDGKLMWRHHRGYKDGSLAWDPARQFGTGWQGMSWVLAQP
jgi:hypothetical protein